MAIVETADPNSPLTQGDILRGVPLHATASDWAGGSEKSKAPGCLVISRPCVAAHKANVVVAAVEPFKTPVPKDADTFDAVCDVLESMRDGADSPDSFYLGQNSRPRTGPVSRQIRRPVHGRAAAGHPGNGTG